MLKLYHGTTSVCSAKVRVGLAELDLAWDGQILDLGKSEQNDDWYLALNPKGVVPTLVDGDLCVVESSVILDFIASRYGQGTFLPDDIADQARAKMWLAECIDIHAAINTLTFSTVKRSEILAKKTPEQIEAGILRMANPANAMKRRDILKNGVASPYVETAFFTLRLMFARMQYALAHTEWLLGARYGIADCALIAYVDRLDRLGLAGLWENNAPRVGAWLEAARARPSYSTAIEHFAGAPDVESSLNKNAGNWDMIAPLWQAYLDARR